MYCVDTVRKNNARKDKRFVGMQIKIFHCARKNASCVASCVMVLNP